jgi:hypothetical protein
MKQLRLPNGVILKKKIVGATRLSEASKREKYNCYFSYKVLIESIVTYKYLSRICKLTQTLQNLMTDD